MKTIFMIFIPYLLLSSAFAIEFKIELNHRTRFCFNQFITQSTPYHFKVSGNHSQFQLSLLFHDGTILKKDSSSNYDKKVDSFAAVSAEYSFCLQNLSQKQQFHIRFLQGIELSDLNSLPQVDDHHKLDGVVDYLNSQYQKVKEKEHYSITVNEFNIQLQKLVSFKAVGFGFLSITVILVISFLHYLEIKRVLRNRKII